MILAMRPASVRRKMPSAPSQPAKSQTQVRPPAPACKSAASNPVGSLLRVAPPISKVAPSCISATAAAGVSYNLLNVMGASQKPDAF